MKKNMLLLCAIPLLLSGCVTTTCIDVTVVVNHETDVDAVLEVINDWVKGRTVQP